MHLTQWNRLYRARVPVETGITTRQDLTIPSSLPRVRCGSPFCHRIIPPIHRFLMCSHTCDTVCPSYKPSSSCAKVIILFSSPPPSPFCPEQHETPFAASQGYSVRALFAVTRETKVVIGCTNRRRLPLKVQASIKPLPAILSVYHREDGLFNLEKVRGLLFILQYRVPLCSGADDLLNHPRQSFRACRLWQSSHDQHQHSCCSDHIHIRF